MVSKLGCGEERQSGWFTSSEVARPCWKMPRKVAAVVVFDEQNVVADGDYGIAIGGGPGLTTGHEGNMMVAV